MNVIIHDLQQEEFQSLFKNINKDTYVISNNGKIKNCIGCFGCWIKTPGRCVINNGFFEGKQNHIAMEQMEIWCESAGAKWGQAIGIGTGEMLPFIMH